MGSFRFFILVLGVFPFSLPPPPRPPIQLQFGAVFLSTPQLHLFALLARAAQQPTMVKSCHFFDPGIAYTMDAKGVIRKAGLVSRRLEWEKEKGRIKYWADNAVVAGQSSACNDLHPCALVVGEVQVKIGKGKTRTIPHSLPRRSLCRRPCWELLPCLLCKVLAKRKK